MFGQKRSFSSQDSFLVYKLSVRQRLIKMDDKNIFNIAFEKVSFESNFRQDVRVKLVEATSKLVEVKRVHAATVKSFHDSVTELSKLESINTEAKNQLVLAVIEKDELEIEAKALTSHIGELKQRLENLERELDIMVSGERLEQIFERYSTSNQSSIIDKITDARFKLIKYGGPPSDS